MASRSPSPRFGLSIECSPCLRWARVASAWMAASVSSDSTRPAVWYVTAGNPLTWPRRSPGGAFFRVSGGHSGRAGDVPDLDAERLGEAAGGHVADTLVRRLDGHDGFRVEADPEG